MNVLCVIKCFAIWEIEERLLLSVFKTICYIVWYSLWFLHTFLWLLWVIFALLRLHLILLYTQHATVTIKVFSVFCSVWYQMVSECVPRFPRDLASPSQLLPILDKISHWLRRIKALWPAPAPNWEWMPLLYFFPAHPQKKYHCWVPL